MFDRPIGMMLKRIQISTLGRIYTPTQDAVDLPKMVQVVCRFQADELLDRLPSAYLVDPIALHHTVAARDIAIASRSVFNR